MKDTQSDMILDALESGMEIDPMFALKEFGCFRLAARINELRAAGYAIETLQRKTDSGKKYAGYVLRKSRIQNLCQSM